MKNFDYKVYLKKLMGFAARFKNILISVAVIGTLLIAILRINSHSNVPLNQQRYDEQLLTIKRVNFDETIVQQILDLNDLNIDINSIFPDNRNNPFN